LRQYCDSTNVPRVLNGLGIAIISTSKGVITDKEARKTEYWRRSLMLCVLIRRNSHVKNR
jgi:hypothetical protein